MSIKYGLISQTDARTLEKTIDLICEQFSDNMLNITELGVYSGETGNGMRGYVELNGRSAFMTGIDNKRDGEALRYEYDNLIIGDSAEVYNKLTDSTQHLVLVDALHTFPAAVADFFCYMQKVKVGAYMIWHDVAPHAQGRDWQRMGDISDSDMSISVRKALTSIGLFENKFEGWQFVMEDYDPSDLAGGMAVFKRVK